MTQQLKVTIRKADGTARVEKFSCARILWKRMSGCAALQFLNLHGDPIRLEVAPAGGSLEIEGA